MVKYLVEHKQADRVVMDPQTRNTRALKCYEKCGFKRIKILPKHEFHEGEYQDCWLIEYTPHHAQTGAGSSPARKHQGPLFALAHLPSIKVVSEKPKVSMYVYTIFGNVWVGIFTAIIVHMLFHILWYPIQKMK